MTTYAGPQPSTILWVSNNGDNATALRGRIDRPFSTIQAAITAADSNDTIQIASGTYFENIVMPDKNLSITGFSQTKTIIQTGGGRTISWVAGGIDPVDSFNLSNLTITNTDPANDAIFIDGSAVVNPDTFLSLFALDRVTINKSGGGQAIRATCMGRIIMTSCSVMGETNGLGVRLVNVSRFGASVCSFWAQAGTFAVPGAPLTALDLNWERLGGAAISGLAREGYYIANSTLVVSNVVLTGQPIFGVDATSTVGGTITATALTFCSGAGLPSQGPVLNLNGTFGGQLEAPAGSGYLTPPVPGVGTITITMPSAATAGAGGPRQILNMGGKFWGSITLSKPVGAPNLRQTVNAKGSVIYPATAAAISVGSLIDLDLRGASFAQSALSVVAASGGTIDRDVITIKGSVLPAPPGSIAIAFPLGAGNPVPLPTAAATAYSVFFSPTAALGVLAVVTSAKTATGFTASALGVGATGDFTIRRDA